MQDTFTPKTHVPFTRGAPFTLRTPHSALCARQPVRSARRPARGTRRRSRTSSARSSCSPGTRRTRRQPSRAAVWKTAGRPRLRSEVRALWRSLRGTFRTAHLARPVFTQLGLFSLNRGRVSTKFVWGLTLARAAGGQAERRPDGLPEEAEGRQARGRPGSA